MTKKHLQFCIYYMQVGDPQVAYKMTYPRAAVKSLKASVSRLMARPDVAEWVNGTEERVHNRMMRKFYSEHYDELKEKLLTINEKRTILTKIIKGETKRVRYIKGKYGAERVEEDLPVYAVLRAVDLDTRLENFYNYLTRSDTWRKAQNIYVNTPTLQQQVNILISQTAEKEESKDTQEHVFPLGRGTEGDNLASNSHEEQNTSPRDFIPPSAGGAPIAIGVGVSSRRTEKTPESEVPEEPIATPEQALSPAACLPRPFRGPDNFGSGGNPARLSRAIRDAGTGVEHSRGTPPSLPRGEERGVRPLAPKKTPRFLTTGHVPRNAGLTPKKNINRLTTEPVSSLTPKKNINKLTTEPVSSLTPKKNINKLTIVNKTGHPSPSHREGVG
jgi:hypothetical protein